MDIFRFIEETLWEASRLLLLVSGVLLTASGLFLWLGGLRLLRPLAVFCAAGAGFWCAWAFTERGVLPLVLLTVIPGAIALFAEKPVVIVLGGCLAGLAVLAYPVFADAGFRASVLEKAGAFPLAEGETGLTAPTAVFGMLAEWAGQWCRVWLAELPVGHKAAAGGALAVTLVAGLAARRWVCALTCASLGTMLIMVGLTALVLSKGAQTQSYLADLGAYVWPAAGGMLAAGTLLNRWLGPAETKQKQPKESHVQGDGK